MVTRKRMRVENENLFWNLTGLKNKEDDFCDYVPNLDTIGLVKNMDRSQKVERHQTENVKGI